MAHKGKGNVKLNSDLGMGKFKSSCKKLAPYALHLLLIAIAGVYVIAGALAIRWIEAVEKAVPFEHDKNPLGKSEAHIGKEGSMLDVDNNYITYQGGKNNGSEEHRSLSLKEAAFLFGSKVNKTLDEHATDNKSGVHSKRKPRSKYSSFIIFYYLYYKKLMLSVIRKRKCVISALKNIAQGTECKDTPINIDMLKILDECYKEDLIHSIRESSQYSKVSLQHADHLSKPTPFTKGPKTPPIEEETSSRNEDPFEIEHLPFIKDILQDDEGFTYWSLMDSLLFCFTVITTIGYGNTAPQTTNGRLFVIFYGLIGVPFTMLVIANLGKFLAEILKQWTKPFYLLFKKCAKAIGKRRKARALSKKQQLVEIEGSESGSVDDSIFEGDVNGNLAGDDDKVTNGSSISLDLEFGKKKKTTFADEHSMTEPIEEEEEENEDEAYEKYGAVSLFIAFVLYIIFGSLLIASYEPEMDFFKAIYFNFVSLSTIGLGDLVPKNQQYLGVTILYCVIGLALTTIAIEIAADTLRKLHYFGRKLEDVGNVAIWFGGQKLSMKQLVKNLGDQFNIPEEELKDLNMTNFVDQAIKVEAGELETLRRPAIDANKPIYITDFRDGLECASVIFADDDDLMSIPPFPNPSVCMNILPSRSLSPSLSFYEHAILTPTPPPVPPDQYGNLSAYENEYSYGTRSELLSSNLDIKIGLSPGRGRQTKKYPTNGRIGNKNFSEEARKRYEAYRQQWQKFRVSQWDVRRHSNLNSEPSQEIFTHITQPPSSSSSRRSSHTSVVSSQPKNATSKPSSSNASNK
uniref:Potassium channel subfamily K member 18 n=1 Tax=Rhabditophanes sp. KR3021 TaxID=114890 RepID=A0AC35TZE3_9BILA